MRKVMLTLSVAAVSLLAMAIFNFLMDPFLVFSKQDEAYLQLQRYAIGKNERMHKAAQIDYYEPDLLVLGWSRARDGINPLHPEFLKRFDSPYNAAQAVQRLQEAQAYYHHARCAGRLKAVLWGVDFGMFAAKHDAFNRSYRPGLLRDEECRGQPLWEKLRISFSWHTTKAALRQLYQLNRPNFFTDRGMTNPAYYRITKRQPMQQFLRAERQYFDDTYADYELGAENLRVFREVLLAAHQHGHEFVLFFSPSHPRLWEVLDIRIGWHVFEQWKREMVRINEEVAGEVGRSPFPLWDFTGYHPLHIEALPEADERRPVMQNYWDTSHFKERLGNILIRRLYDTENKYKSFGQRLTGDTIEQHLNRLRVQRAAWLRQNPELRKDMRQALLKDMPPCVKGGEAGCPIGEAVTP
ncbi:hypothetical protein CO724_16480 [Ectopseudomonas mendocina]|nr:hypothetical protein CO724_16480 [Pseudomonas mendocina]